MFPKVVDFITNQDRGTQKSLGLGGFLGVEAQNQNGEGSITPTADKVTSNSQNN